MHKWEKKPNTKEPGVPYHKNWVCIKCGCEKTQGMYKYSTPIYSRSLQTMDYCPPCVDMGRRSNEPLD